MWLEIIELWPRMSFVCLLEWNAKRVMSIWSSINSLSVVEVVSGWGNCHGLGGWQGCDLLWTTSDCRLRRDVASLENFRVSISPVICLSSCMCLLCLDSFSGIFTYPFDLHSSWMLPLSRHFVCKILLWKAWSYEDRCLPGQDSSVCISG